MQCRGEFGRRRQVWFPYNPHMYLKARPEGSHPGEGPPSKQTHRWTAPVLGEKKWTETAVQGVWVGGHLQ